LTHTNRVTMIMTGPDPYTNPAASSGTSILDVNELLLTKKIWSLREHYDIADRSGNLLAVGEGNFIQIPAIFQVTDARYGQVIMQIEGKVLSLHNQFTFTDNLGMELGILRKKLVKFIGDEFWMEKDGKELMRIYGDFLEHDYRMEMDGKLVARVHREWASIRDQYGISVLGNVDHRLVVGAVIVIEHIEMAERRAGS
jgi:uncharacterized protein YxjI